MCVCAHAIGTDLHEGSISVKGEIEYWYNIIFGHDSVALI